MEINKILMEMNGDE